MKRFDEMNRNMESFVEINKNAFPLVEKTAQMWAAYLRDDQKTVKILLPQIEGHAREAYFSDYWTACFYFYVGEVNTGFEWLERSYAKKESQLLDIKPDEFLEKHRSDPRYLDLLKRLGLDAETK